MGAKRDKLEDIDECGVAMSRKREQLKAEIMAQVEMLVAEALAKGEKPLTLEEIEDIALAARDRVGQSLTGSLVEQQADSGEVEPPPGPECGQPMRAKGRKGRHLRTRSGETRVERPYFHCTACGRGYFPPR
jgi:hypothetical protein